MKKGGLSKLIDDPVRWQAVKQRLDDARAQLDDLLPDTLQEFIDEATDAVRSEMREALSEPESSRANC